MFANPMIMQKIGLALVILLGLGLGLWWPTGNDAGASASPAGITEISYSQHSDGHFYADALVNGASVRFLVDTGSTTVALTEEDAERAGVQFDPDSFSLLGEGASGHVRGQPVTLGKLELGQIEVKDVKAAVIEGASMSLLGVPVLEQIDEIVIRKDQMTLRKQR